MTTVAVRRRLALVACLFVSIVMGAQASAAGINAEPSLDLIGRGLFYSAAGVSMRDDGAEAGADVGFQSQWGERSGVLSIDLRGPIQRAYLFWSGYGSANGGQEMRLNGRTFPGVQIGVQATAEGMLRAYRADVTQAVQALYAANGPGGCEFTVFDPAPDDNLEEMLGASIVVVQKNPEDDRFRRILVFEGLEWLGQSSTDPITLRFDPRNADRALDICLITGEATAELSERIVVETEGSLDEIDNALIGADGPGWDTFRTLVDVPFKAREAQISLAQPADQPESDSVAWQAAIVGTEVDDPGDRGAIGDYIWKDTIENGIQDLIEPGLQGVTVELYRKLSSGGRLFVASTVTGVDGRYGFGDLPAGQYELEVLQWTLPSGEGLVPTTPNVGDEEIDSDFVANQAAMVLGTNESVADVDGGYIPTGGPTVRGACCLPGGGCVFVDEASCQAQGGEFQGENVSCAQADCPDTGACCFCDGTCLDLEELDCFLQGGVFQGADTECASVVCEPFGACCYYDGTCVDGLTEAECLADPDAVSWTECGECDPTFCPELGACCYYDGTCVDGLTEAECDTSDPFVIEFHPGLRCDEVQCTVYGACCFVGGVCIERLTEAECDVNEPDVTAWHPGLLCGQVVCDDFLGACCFYDGTCIDNILEDDCLAMTDAISWTIGVTCDADPCVPLGACCFYDGTCQDGLTETACFDLLDAVSWTSGARCGDVVCDVLGACCYYDGTCADSITEADCLADPDAIAWTADARCGDVVCDVLGACCFYDGTCTEGVTETACLADPDAISFTAGARCGDVACDVLGACCYYDGTCADGITESECLANPDAISFSAGDQCGDVTCDVLGACCLYDGSCIDGVTEAQCTANPDGISFTAGARCGDVVCDALGACCYYDGTCADGITESECLADADAISFSAGDRCGDVVCDVLGACCFFDGTCQEGLTEAGCLGMPDAVSWSAGARCTPGFCDTLGACCLYDGSCIGGVTEAECLSNPDAISFSAGQQCADVVCDVLGACCLFDGTCVDSITEAECMTMDFIEFTAGARCANVTCDVYGACLLCNGDCLELTEDECEGLSDPSVEDKYSLTWIAGAMCLDIEPIMQGACCFSDETCGELSPDECEIQGGVYQGDCVTCAEVDCTQPDPTQARGCGSEKGSLVIFPSVEVRWDAQGVVIQDTFLQLTNDSPGQVDVLMYFVNGDAPVYENGELVEPGWNWVDNQITLTSNQPTYWSASSGQPAQGGLSPWRVLDPEGPGRYDPETGDRVLRGFVIAWAVSSTGEEIRWDHLAGTVTMINYEDDWAWEYSACSFQVVDPAIAHGEQTGTPGVISMDGSEYAYAFSMLMLNFNAVDSNSFSGGDLSVTVGTETDLALLPMSIDVRQESAGPIVTKAHMDVWNMNEVKFSGAYRCVECWSQSSLRDTHANHFQRQFLQTDHGKARIDGLASHLCDADGRVSIDAAMLGLSRKRMWFNGSPTAAAGASLFGMGLETAEIRFDVVGAPPSLPVDADAEELRNFVDYLLELRTD